MSTTITFLHKLLFLAIIAFFLPFLLQAQSIVRSTPTDPVADLLDVQFNADGSAQDISPMNIPIYRIDNGSNKATTYYNNFFKRHVVKFTPNLPIANKAGSVGGNAETYYRADYSENTAFKSQLESGHTLELITMIDLDGQGFEGANRELKPFSGHEQGGTGIMLHNKSTEPQPRFSFTFLVNVDTLTSGVNTTTGNNLWAWAMSNTVPVENKYYHVVGVWDQEEKNSRIYINGELHTLTHINGVDFNWPKQKKGFANADPGFQWFGIGADTGDNVGQTCWRGDVAVARIYSASLDNEGVTTLWNKVKADVEAANGLTSINNPSTQALITISPNPTSDYILVNLENVQGIAPLYIYSLDGKLVYNIKLAGGATETVSLKGLTPSIYTVLVNGQSFKLAVK